MIDIWVLLVRVNQINESCKDKHYEKIIGSFYSANHPEYRIQIQKNIPGASSSCTFEIYNK